MKKIAIIVDRMDSGLGIAANGRAEVDKRISVIPALSFSSPERLLKRLEIEEYDDVIFSWRYLLLEIFADSKLNARLSDLRNYTQIGILIPDYQGFSNNGVELNYREDSLLERVDYFHVTNFDLEQRYLRTNHCNKYSGVLHDLTAIQDILATRRLNLNRRKKILWIGNSKWGTRSGYVDYKGYIRVIQPIIKNLSDKSSEYEVEIVDLARKKLSHKCVLHKIATSEILLVASDYEGTGLPILEAIGLGTYVISTNVGIAPEILIDSRVGIILNQDPSEFLSVIVGFEYQANDQITEELFHDYVSRAMTENIGRKGNVNIHTNLHGNVTQYDLRMRLKWFFRYLKNLE
jgi:hypothetical protein